MPKGVYQRSQTQIEALRQMGIANRGKKFPHTPEWNSKIGLAQKGEKNHAWVGDRVSYKGLHDWVNKNWGKPDTCEHCGSSGLSGMYINWASKEGNYTRNREDWLRLCKSCHNTRDGIVNNFKK